jgi:hypothetical protein
MPFGHSRFCKCDPIGSLNDYSCSPPGVGAVSVAPSVLLFLCFLAEGLAEESALVDFSALVAFSPLVDFFELLVLELDGLPVSSAAVPVLEVALCVALVGEALALAAAEAVAAAVADAVALGEALAETVALGEALAETVALGEALIPAEALGEA